MVEVVVESSLTGEVEGYYGTPIIIAAKDKELSVVADQPIEL